MIQSATAEIWRGKKRRKKGKKKETTGQKYNGLPYSIGPPEKHARGKTVKCIITGYKQLQDRQAHAATN